MSLDELIAGLENDSMERLRWLVAVELGISPYCLSDWETLKCGAHMAAGRRAGAEAGANPAFDPALFERMRKGDGDGAGA